MTIQLVSQQFGNSKKALEDQLNRDPALVHFEDPSIFSPRSFTGAEVARNQSFAVVMDHPKRMRFAKISRGREDKFKVS